MNELHLFAGAGGGILGGLLLGHRPVCAVEIDEYNRKILLQRQRDKLLPKFPVWDDVKTFNGREWAGRVDVICGGFPCQDISFAGKRAGISGEKSGLWKEYARIINEVQPGIVFAENSARLINNGLEEVIQDFAEMGYDCKWGCFTAAGVGAPHLRERCFVMAYPLQPRGKGDWWGGWAERRVCVIQKARKNGGKKESARDELWPPEPQLERIVSDGVACGVDRHYAIGNGQVPAVAKLAWESLSA